MRHVVESSIVKNNFFSSSDRELWPMTSTSEYDLDRINMNQ